MHLIPLYIVLSNQESWNVTVYNSIANRFPQQQLSAMISVPDYAVPSAGEMILPAAVFGVLAIAVTLYKFVFAVSEYDNLGLPLAGEPDGAKRFSLKSRLRYYYDCAALYTDAYYRVGPHPASDREPSNRVNSLASTAKPPSCPGTEDERISSCQRARPNGPPRNPTVC